MTQLELFAQGAVAETGGAARRAASQRDTRPVAFESPVAALAAGPVAPAEGEAAWPCETVAESEQIVAALHARSAKGWEAALDGLLSDEERVQLRATRELPHQRALLFDRVVERLTRRWGDLNAWPPFARVVERGTHLKRGLRVCTLEFFAESRGLSGRVAFKTERDLRRVTAPIPAPVLRALDEQCRGPFAGFAYMEPLYTRGGRRLLRSVAEARQTYCRPIDPIIIGWLGGGPRNYGMAYPWTSDAARASWRRGVRPNSLGELVFLVGHWD